MTARRIAVLAGVLALTASADAAVAAGFLLPPERDELVERAGAAAVPA